MTAIHDIGVALQNFREVVHPSPPMDTSDFVEKAHDAYAETQIKEREPDDLNYFRCSSIPNMCIRWEVFRRILPELSEASALWERDMLLRFRMGRLIEQIWRDECLARSGQLVGTWTCSVCHSERTGRMPDKPCPRSIRTLPFDETGEPVQYMENSCVALGTRWEYREQKLRHDRWKVQGSCDAFFYNPEYEIVGEIKSDRPSEGETDPGGWENRQAADPGHIEQVNGYAWIRGARHCLLNYVHMGDIRKVKTYYHRFDPTLIEEWQKKILKVHELVEARNPYAVPRCDGCKKITNARATRCPARALCFAREL